VPYQLRHLGKEGAALRFLRDVMRHGSRAAASRFLLTQDDEHGGAHCFQGNDTAAAPGVLHRTGRYRTNGIERDHGFLKERLRPMRGLKCSARIQDSTVTHTRLLLSSLNSTVEPCWRR